MCFIILLGYRIWLFWMARVNGFIPKHKRFLEHLKSIKFICVTFYSYAILKIESLMS